MKKSELLILIILFINFFTACDKNTEIENSDTFSISPANLSLNVSPEGGAVFYTVKSDEGIAVSSDSPDWCMPVLSNVSIDNLRINISKNEFSFDRKAIISVSSGEKNHEIIITQEAHKTEITVNQYSVSVQYGKQEFTLDITSNIKIKFDLPDWISEKENNSWQMGKKKYSFTMTDIPKDMMYRSDQIVITPYDQLIEHELVLVSVVQKAPTKVVAHRGYWSIPTYPQNSLASLQRAIDLQIYGSELDVWITTDGVLLINHDPSIQGINLENSSSEDLSVVRLSNGEPLPTLEQCLDMIKQQNKTKLIIEIKPHSQMANENRAAAAVYNLVKEKGMADQVDYISFSQNICERLIEANPNNRVAYLNGNLEPSVLKERGYWGLDYSHSVLKVNKNWTSLAFDLDLTSNVWTVNNSDDMNLFIDMGITYITTDYPDLLIEELNRRHKN